MIENILNSLTDKNNDNRAIAEDIIIFLIQIFGETEINNFVKTKTKTFKDMFKNIVSKIEVDIVSVSNIDRSHAEKSINSF